MSLATRCAACGTVFRVVQDQLRVSAGWVRCGRCGEVFNAIESLVDLEIDRPGDAGPPSVHGVRVMQDLARVAGKGESDRLPGSQPAAVTGRSTDEGAGRWTTPAVTESGPPDRDRTAEGDARSHGPHEPQAGEAVSRVEAVEAGVGPSISPRVPQPSSEPSAGLAPRLAAPAFVRQADRAARWRHPVVRALLSSIGVLAFIGLGWQVSFVHHNRLAAHWPVLMPVLEQVCAMGGCRIEPPRHIESLVVDSSGLLRSPAATGYRLTVALRNRDSYVVRAPAVDLVLTDALGQVIASRVLTGQDLGAVSDRIDAGASLTLAAVLDVDNEPVVGYRIELFYP